VPYLDVLAVQQNGGIKGVLQVSLIAEQPSVEMPNGVELEPVSNVSVGEQGNLFWDQSSQEYQLWHLTYVKYFMLMLLFSFIVDHMFTDLSEKLAISILK
jgi:hypothetical protein